MPKIHPNINDIINNIFYLLNFWYQAEYNSPPQSGQYALMLSSGNTQFPFISFASNT